jgi:hypothetical protein
MQLTKGAVDGVPSLIDFDRNQFAVFPFGHELAFSDGRPSGFQASPTAATLPLSQLSWQPIPFSARVREMRQRRAPR